MDYKSVCNHWVSAVCNSPVLNLITHIIDPSKHFQPQSWYTVAFTFGPRYIQNRQCHDVVSSLERTGQKENHKDRT